MRRLLTLLCFSVVAVMTFPLVGRSALPLGFAKNASERSDDTSTQDIDSTASSVALHRTSEPAPLVHRIELQLTPGAIIHTDKFLEGANSRHRTMNHSTSYKLSYAFLSPPATHPQTYQGVGLAYNQFNDLMGNPVSFYIFQGARIASLGRCVSLNYEWNLGLSAGWKAYDRETNPDNRVIGSSVTAYINADLYFAFRLCRQLDLNAGLGFTHFSNGNTTIPNRGLNVANARLGLAYYINRTQPLSYPPKGKKSLPSGRSGGGRLGAKRLHYDLTLYGFYRRRGAEVVDGTFAYRNKFAVVGINVNPLYSLTPWFNLGMSLDAVLDRSANLQLDANTHLADLPLGLQPKYPSLGKQMALGLSARAELAMPWFTINAGMGHNVVNATGDFSQWYQILALKASVSRHVYLHIGYNIIDFNTPNHLMIGLGYRFSR
jgi:hypothetical protein